jgi:phosphatidylethanolamine/phosphatidyl-N-methylethanolamine N-methyltransferase
MTQLRSQHLRHGHPNVESIYRRLAPVYDLMYGVALEHGRRQAIARLAPAKGESVLEVGIGTGLSTVRYPSDCRVVGIDLSDAMLDRARQRLARRNVTHVTLCRMDVSHLAFADNSFDAVLAAYLINVVPSPVAAAREMLRVCRPGGRVVLLNHFREPRVGDSVGRILGQIAWRAGGAQWDLDLQTLLREAGLHAVSIDRVNLPRVSSVVVCRKS